ncbi:hypothetical protein KO361_03775 [Candidatus Woesearchaeota archaeon]|nr:hypothetical protein [Candidatus Woesearchaeota archaeon]
MGDSELSVICRVCQRKVSMDRVRFDEVRKLYVCDNCFNSNHGFDERNSFVGEAERSVKSLKDSLVKYTCVKCRYHFVRQKNKEISSCPYCGSDKLEILDTGASKIIEESHKFF